MSRETENIFDTYAKELFGKPWSELVEVPEREQVRQRMQETEDRFGTLYFRRD